jgi:dTDP-4-dehydrorhamnose 3,5-epimerase
MIVKDCHIEGLKIIEPKVFGDERGYFFESFNAQKFVDNVQDIAFVQDNESLSSKGVIRGLHFQEPPYDQGKLVRVIKGAVKDVVVDIRKSSNTYGKTFAIELTEDNKTQFWIPSGFAHGFETLEDNTIFAYKCTAPYNTSSENSIFWNDPALGIDWTTKNPIISEKDKLENLFTDFKSPF